MRSLLAWALLALACERPPPRRTPDPIASLAALHDAIERGDPTPAVDSLSFAQAEFLQRMSLLHDIQHAHAGEVPAGFSEAAWRNMWSELNSANSPPRLMREFGPARALLGSGRCVQLSVAPLSDALSALATPRSTWPAFAVPELRTGLAQRVRGARAADFRCDGSSAGATFRATFIPRADGSLAVARITAL